MFLWRCFPIFLLLRNASQAPETDNEDSVSKTIDSGYTASDESNLPAVASAFWNPGPEYESNLPAVASAFWNPGPKYESHTHVIAELMSDEGSDLSASSRETEEMGDVFRRAATAVNDVSAVFATTTRAFWHSKKERESRNTRKNIEREFLAQYDHASLQTDLTKLDEDKLRLVCQISSPKETYHTSRRPRFRTKSLRFLSSRKRRMTANLLYCPNMSAYVRESATNPSQCVYIFKRRFFFCTKLWLQSQKCVNLKSETTAPPPPPPPQQTTE